MFSSRYFQTSFHVVVLFCKNHHEVGNNKWSALNVWMKGEKDYHPDKKFTHFSPAKGSLSAPRHPLRDTISPLVGQSSREGQDFERGVVCRHQKGKEFGFISQGTMSKREENVFFHLNELSDGLKAALHHGLEGQSRGIVCD